jgi:hypothetical protein
MDKTLPGALFRECFIHFLLFLCSDFAIMSTMELPFSGGEPTNIEERKMYQRLKM